MPDLAYIHPLLVKNPLPADGLHGAVRQLATAGARMDAALAALVPHDPAQPLAGDWRTSLRALLDTGAVDVAGYAERVLAELAPMQSAAPFAATDAAACATLAGRLQALHLAAAAGAAAAHETARALAAFAARAADAPFGATLAAVIAGQTALQLAWTRIAQGIAQLLAGLRPGTCNSALLAAHLDAARADWSLLASNLGGPRMPTAHEAEPGPRSHRPALRSVSAFRHGDVRDGAEAVAAVIGLLDSLAAGIAQLPSSGPASAPLVGRHIDTARLHAEAWSGCVRPALAESLLALRQFGQHVVERDAPGLEAALARIEPGHEAARLEAARMASGAGRRLDRLARRFVRAAQALDKHLDAMALTSGELEGDTAAVAARLQQGQARISTLVCHAGRAQRRLNGVRHAVLWRWLHTPLAALARRRARLAGVSRELNGMRLEHAAAMRDAASLQELVPALSSYLTAVDRAGAGVSAMLAGTRALQAQMSGLHAALHAGDASGAAAAAQLHAALADWRAIARAAGRLPRP